MDAAVQMPLSRRINVRMIVFFAVVSIPFIYVASIFVKSSLNGGIEHNRDGTIVDLKALGNFPFDNDHGTDDAIPPAFRKLDGQRIKLDGFMFSRNASGPRLNKFEFVYNVGKCCFNGPPLVQERVYASMPPGKTMPYVDNFIRLTGILHVKVVRDGETVQSVYTLDVERADPA